MNLWHNVTAGTNMVSSSGTKIHHYTSPVLLKSHTKNSSGQPQKNNNLQNEALKQTSLLLEKNDNDYER